MRHVLGMGQHHGVGEFKSCRQALFLLQGRVKGSCSGHKPSPAGADSKAGAAISTWMSDCGTYRSDGISVLDSGK